jgi:hypothetical protein
VQCSVAATSGVACHADLWQVTLRPPANRSERIEELDQFLEALRSAVETDGLRDEALADAVSARMKAYLPNEDLLFLARLSVAPMRDRLLFRQIDGGKSPSIN